jgi:hypothetical protein
MRAAARSIGRSVAPGVMAERARTYERELRKSQGLVDLARRFVDLNGTTVRNGPFAGLSYPRRLVLNQADAPIAKLLGVYEEELHSTLDDVIAIAPRAIIDIGAADGYYAVGFARACPSSAVHAFELTSSGRASCRELARSNSVRLELHGKATARRVRALPLDGAFVLCDIEGAEASVLDQPTANAMQRSTVVVELHEREVPGITRVLRERFVAHDCTIISGRPRAPDATELEAFTPIERELAVAEWRSYIMTWAVLRPRT